MEKKINIVVSQYFGLRESYSDIEFDFSDEVKFLVSGDTIPEVIEHFKDYCRDNEYGITTGQISELYGQLARVVAISLVDYEILKYKKLKTQIN